MDAKFSVLAERHNFEIGQPSIATPLSVPVRLRYKTEALSQTKNIDNSIIGWNRIVANNDNTKSKMTMKHPREDERLEATTGLLGSDHSKRKRQRTLSIGSDSSSTENRSCNSNARKKIIPAGTESSNAALSPRMMALLSSLEALDDKQQRQIKQQWPLGSTKSSTPTPPVIPNPSTASPNQQDVSTLLQQKHAHPQVGQPLTARPAIHKIEEHPAPAVDTAAINTIKRAVAAATANTLENNASYSTAVNAALAHHRIAGAAALAAVAKTSPIFTHSPSLTPSVLRAPGLPLALHSFPTLGAVTHLQHQRVAQPSSALRGPSTRQVAIHNAVHSDYKKTYKPLKRPPRLPTPHEAMVIAAVSTATPATSACR